MTEQPQPNLASVEADLFGTLFAFHKKAVSLLRESSLDDENKKVVAVRIKTLLDNTTAEMKTTKQPNVAERLDAIFEEAKRLVDELSQSDDGKKAKPKTRRLKGQKNKP
jgi:hypothetical protein